MMRSSIYGILAVALAASATNTSAQDNAKIYQPSTEWSVERQTDRCVARRQFTHEDDTAKLVFEHGGSDDAFNMTIIGNAVRNTLGPLVSIQFGPEEKPSGRNYISAKTRAGEAALVLYGVRFAPAERAADGSFIVETLDAERLAAIEFLQIERAGLKRFRLETGGLSELSEAIDQCAEALEKTFLSTEKGGRVAQGAVPLDQGSWVQSSDYPGLMQKYGMGARIAVRLTVGTAGRATFCQIKDSTVPQMFEDALCLALMRRARFEPALNDQGDRVPSYWNLTVDFKAG
ncbi:TonB family protein [Qipengyuania seohaensis]|uniref:TonB family protein n=1 Tax=Qipengyuania seohaensis TaxID=266951 RepID=UPI000C21F7FA|nr:TonB family protein [Qipengyuania seohaensis]